MFPGEFVKIKKIHEIIFINSIQRPSSEVLVTKIFI